MADISTGRQRGIVPFVDETTGRLPDQYLPQGVIDLQGDLEQAVTNAGASATEAKASATAAQQSASAASASASAAKASETNAASSVSAAKVSETNAAASATAAREAVDGFGLEVGTTTTGEPGSDAAVEIQKQGAKYTANFTIPRGDKGEPAVIEHNKTLVGDGTPSSPLSVADGTLLSTIDVLGSFDFNDKKGAGVYNISSDNVINSPREQSVAYGALFVIPSSVENGVFQLFFSVEATEVVVYIRLLRNDWMPWKSITMSANISALESRIAALNAKSNELAGMETRLQALEARVKSLETN